MPRLIDDAIEPGAHCGKFAELEIALVGKVRVAVKRDVRDRIMAGREEVVRRKTLLRDKARDCSARRTSTAARSIDRSDPRVQATCRARHTRGSRSTLRDSAHPPPRAPARARSDSSTGIAACAPRP